MPRQYPPAITDAIYKLQQEIGAVQTWNDAVWINNNFVKVVYKHLGPYLLPPSQHANIDKIMEDMEQYHITHYLSGRDVVLPCNIRQVLEKHLPPSQHLKDKATMYFGDEGGQGGAEVHIYSTVNDNEPLPEKVIDDKTKLGIYDTTQNIMQDIRTYVYEYDEVQKMRLLALLDKHLLKFGGQEQTTPKIDMDKLNMMLYAGSDMEGNSWGADIPGAIKMIADYINNKD